MYLNIHSTRVMCCWSYQRCYSGTVGGGFVITVLPRHVGSQSPPAANATASGPRLARLEPPSAPRRRGSPGPTLLPPGVDERSNEGSTRIRQHLVFFLSPINVSMWRFEVLISVLHKGKQAWWEQLQAHHNLPHWHPVRGEASTSGDVGSVRFTLSKQTAEQTTGSELCKLCWHTVQLLRVSHPPLSPTFRCNQVVTLFSQLWQHIDSRTKDSRCASI